jgi:hypothetical protein
MRLPSLETDYWALASGEERHEESPDSFWIPSLSERQSLKVEQAAKLIFEIESENEEGEVERDCERMWVVVSEIKPPYYIGRLTNKPVTVGEDEDFYLKLDVEVPFLPEHVIDIDQPPEEFLKALFSEEPKGVWPRAQKAQQGGSGDAKQRRA